MAWWDFTLAVGAGLALIVGIGAAIAFALRLTGLWLAAAAAPVGVSLVAVTATACGWLGVPFTVPVLAGAGVLAVVACGLAARLGRAHRLARPPRSTAAVTGVAVILGVLLLTGRFTWSIGDPGLFAQVGDNVFHLNAVRSILDGEPASPLGFGGFGDAENSLAFYPTAWHAATAMVAQLSGAAVPVASNAMLFLFACIAWPLSAVLLTRSMFGRRPAVLLAAGILSAGFAMYPFQLVPYMGAFPLVAAVPLMAVSLAAVWSTCRLGQTRLPPASATALLILTSPGVAMMHPSAFVMLVVLSLAPVSALLIRLGRRGAVPRRLLALLFGLALTLVLAVVVLARAVLAQEGSWRGTIAQSIGEYLLLALSGRPIPLAMVVLVALGVVFAITRRSSSGGAAVASFVLVGVIYVAAAGNDEFFRQTVSGPWYADATRVAAFAPVVALPLAARGVQAVWMLLARTVARARFRTSRRTRAVLGVAACLALAAVAVVEPGVRYVDRATRAIFEPTDEGVVSRVGVGLREREVLEQVEALVPRDSVIAGSPFDGSSFAYALTGRRVLVAHLLAPLTTSEQAFLDGFASAGEDDAACEAAREHEIEWILEFHPDKPVPHAPRFAGLQDLDDSPNAELAFRSGSSSLYRVTGCGMG